MHAAGPVRLGTCGPTCNGEKRARGLAGRRRAFALKPALPYLTRSSLHRCFQRHGLLARDGGHGGGTVPFQGLPDRPFPHRHRRGAHRGGRLHLFVAVGRTSKVAFDHACEQRGIEHRTTSPTTRGRTVKVERMVVEEFRDPAVSGADPLDQREGFTRLLAWCAESGVRTIIVENASRFARDLIVQETGHALLKAQGFALIAADDPDAFTADTPTARMVRQILGAVSEFEKANLVAKLRGARDRASAAAGRRIEGRKGYAETNPKLVRRGEAAGAEVAEDRGGAEPARDRGRSWRGSATSPPTGRRSRRRRCKDWSTGGDDTMRRWAAPAGAVIEEVRAGAVSPRRPQAIRSTSRRPVDPPVRTCPSHLPSSSIGSRPAMGTGGGALPLRCLQRVLGLNPQAHRRRLHRATPNIDDHHQHHSIPIAVKVST